MTADILTRDGLAGTIRTEQAALKLLLETIGDDDWATRTREDGWTIHDLVGHIADSLFGINMLVRGQLPPGQPLDMDALNAQRRERNLPLSRAEIESKLAKGFDTVLTTVEELPDLDAPGPFGPDQTLGWWLSVTAFHTAEHRAQLEQIMSQ